MLGLRSFRVPARQWLFQSCRYNSTSSLRQFNILFCGSDNFSVCCLKGLMAGKDTYKSIHVITPEPSRSGRSDLTTKEKKIKHKSDLQVFAEENGLPNSHWPARRSRDETDEAQTVAVGDGEASGPAEEAVKPWLPPPPFDAYDESNMLITASFGHIIPNEVLDKFNPGHRLNVHPSRLPKYRGAAPLQWAILNGDWSFDMCIQRLVEKGKGIDSGHLVGWTSGKPIRPFDTFTSLLEIAGNFGGGLLRTRLRSIQKGNYKVRVQDKRKVTHAPKLGKQDSKLDIDKHSAEQIYRMHRALSHQYPVWTESPESPDRPIQLIDPRPANAHKIKFPENVLKLIAETPDIGPGIAWFDYTYEYATSKEGRPAKKGRMILICKADQSSTSAEDVPKESKLSFLQFGRMKPEGRNVMSARDWWNGRSPTSTAKKEGWMRFVARDSAEPPKSPGEESPGEESTGEEAPGEESTGEESTGEVSTGEVSTGEVSTGEVSTGEVSTGEVR